MSIRDRKISEIASMKVFTGFVEVAELGLSSREEIAQKIDEIDTVIEKLNDDLKDVQKGLAAYENISENQSTSESYELAERWGLQPDLNRKYEQLIAEREELTNIRSTLVALFKEHKNFDKDVFFTNIRNLLKEKPEIKIGKIEKEAGVRLGYTARLEKTENTAEPSVEYVVTAAKMLGVSLDSILRIPLNELTPTEQYLVKFLDKLKNDTLQDKLEWQKESPDLLNRMECDINGRTEHPLFHSETFMEEGETDYPDEVSRVVFVSNAFGPQTFICDNCYNLRMKNGTILYLMNIQKSNHKINDSTVHAKEIWIVAPSVGNNFLCGTKNDSLLEPAVTALFETVADRAKHPKIKKELKYVMDAFMRNDIDDDDETLPFN